MNPLSNIATWLRANENKRVVQVTCAGPGYLAMAVEQQADGSGKEAARQLSMELQEAVVGLARKLK
jgi:hypothetical protein